MGSSKLKAMHVVIIGAVACVLVGVGTYFLVIKKKYESLNALNGRLTVATEQANKRSQVLARLETAKQTNKALQISLERYLREKMPPISFEDRAQGMIALWKEQVETLGPMLRSWPQKSGVVMTGGVSVPAPPADPNTIDASLIKIAIGSFAVRGDFRTLLTHVRSWNKFGRLVQIDVKALQGPSPFMTLNYDVTVYIFPRGGVGQPIPMATQSSTM
jgi:hypothetical protein